MTETVRMNPNDADLFDDDKLSGGSIMDDIREDLAAEVEEEIYEAVTPMRAKFQMMYKTNFDFDQLKAWTKKSKESRAKDAPVDMKKLSILVLLNTCVGMKYNTGTEEAPRWREVTADDGRAMTFAHPQLQQMLKCMGGAYQAVEKMYVKDGHIMMVAQVVTAKAGYTDLDFDADNDPLEI